MRATGCSTIAGGGEPPHPLFEKVENGVQTAGLSWLPSHRIITFNVFEEQ
ncbi:hypothetical protein [Gulosibacter sediminis]|nr:hypothetical protein [Gulosibacter sediminis]